MARGDKEDQGTLGSPTSETAQDCDQWLSMVSKVPDECGTHD